VDQAAGLEQNTDGMGHKCPWGLSFTVVRLGMHDHLFEIASKWIIEAMGPDSGLRPKIKPPQCHPYGPRVMVGMA